MSKRSPRRVALLTVIVIGSNNNNNNNDDNNDDNSNTVILVILVIVINATRLLVARCDHVEGMMSVLSSLMSNFEAKRVFTGNAPGSSPHAIPPTPEILRAAAKFALGV